MKTIILAAAINFILACTTPSHQVNELDAGKLDVKGQVNDGTIGINEKNQAVIREERTVQDELRIQEMVNMHLQDDVRRNLFALKECRRDMADPRLGGDGAVPASTELDSLEDQIDQTEQMGLDEESGDLKIVRESFLNDKLKLERKKENTYRQVIKVSGRHLEQCEGKMAVARRKAGLPSKRVEADGYFSADGTYTPTRQGERDLDDAFEAKARNHGHAPASEKAKAGAAPKAERQEIEEKVNAMFDGEGG